MRAIKYLEYRVYIAARLLYLCSSPMELNLTVVSTDIKQFSRVHKSSFIMMMPFFFYVKFPLPFRCWKEVIDMSQFSHGHILLLLLCDTLAPYRKIYTRCRWKLRHWMTRTRLKCFVRLNESNFCALIIFTLVDGQSRWQVNRL